MTDHAFCLLTSVSSQRIRYNSLHNQNSSIVEFVDCPFWWDTHSTDEQSGFTLNDDVNKLWKLAICVVPLAQGQRRNPSLRLSRYKHLSFEHFHQLEVSTGRHRMGRSYLPDCFSVHQWILAGIWDSGGRHQ